MPPGRDALPSDIFHPPVSADWPQSNQRTHDHLSVIVAVRDKTPQRFQIVPFREVSNFGPRSHSLNIQTKPKNILHESPSGKRSQIRRLQSSSSHSRSLEPCDESREVRKPVTPEGVYLGSSQEGPTKADVARSGGHLHSRRALVELDLNRDMRVSTATTKPFGNKPISMHGLPSRGLLTPFSRATPRASTGNKPSHDTLTTLGSHISEISQLFSAETVASLPSMRRNRSTTGSSMRSDTSAGMSTTSQETEAKLKRRHAIYRESCIPYLGRSQGKDIVALDNLSIGAHRDLGKSTMDTKVDKGINFDQVGGPAEASRLAHPQFNLVGRPKIQRLPNSGGNGLFPVRALKLSKKIDKHRMPQVRGEISNPQIVLDLLRDIDEEIAQWTQA